jgi:hypothetical protein
VNPVYVRLLGADAEMTHARDGTDFIEKARLGVHLWRLRHMGAIGNEAKRTLLQSVSDGKRNCVICRDWKSLAR